MTEPSAATREHPRDASGASAVDRGELRDKVAATDPATAPASADGEAAGAPTPAARRAVPSLDRDRAVSTADHPRHGSRPSPFAVGLVLCGAGTAILVALALALTLP
jgi:hypothetical protein